MVDDRSEYVSGDALSTFNILLFSCKGT